MSDLVLKQINFASAYLERLSDNGYETLDINMIEPLYFEDKKYHPTTITFERNNVMMAVRSDWTRSILHYKERYYSEANKFAYFGPVIRNNMTLLQAGAELYDVNDQDMVDSITMHLDFIQERSKEDLTTMIMSDEALIDLYMDKYKLSEKIRPLIYDKNISTLGKLLGQNHALYQLLIQPVSQQFALIKSEFPNEAIVNFLEGLMADLESYQLKTIVDLSFRSPQEYYNGFFFQIFLTENTPILSGGQYGKGAFGIGVNVADGGVL